MQFRVPRPRRGVRRRCRRIRRGSHVGEQGGEGAAGGGRRDGCALCPVPGEVLLWLWLSSPHATGVARYLPVLLHG